MAETFVNYKSTVTTANSYKKIRTYRVSWARNLSFFVYNRSFTNSAVLRIMLSPNRKIWTMDGTEIEVGPRELVTLVPNYFSKYITLEYRSQKHCHPAKLDIWFQMTRPPARRCFGVGNDWS